MRLEDLTSADVARMRRKPVVLLPVGAVEQHGPHLPLGADILQPMYVLERVSQRTGALVAPPIPYGLVQTSRPFPGSISVSFDALRAYVRDVLAELVRNGFRRIVVVSGHAEGVHLAALRTAAKEVVDLGDADITVLSDYEIIYGSEYAEEGEGHAGKIETSRVMAARPDLVRRRPSKGRNRIPKYAVVLDARRHWPGVTGDPRKATAKFGQKLDRLVEDALVRIVRQAAKRNP
ncbi:MAG TPA: creatininase family protein [Thermoplasmata archaeon]|jgi:creatinine amidohydrolase|nr:creatininase family protein [Thermoplasmata archaeon]